NSQSQRWMLAILMTLIALDTFPSIRMLYGLALLNPSQYPGGEKNWWAEVIRRPEPELQKILTRLRDSPWNETVLTTAELGYEFSIHSGQSVAVPDFNTVAFGVLPSLLNERKKTIQGLVQDFSMAGLERSPIRWLIFPCADFESAFS